MDEEKRIIIKRNRVLLVENIILTDEFYNYLKSEGIFPDTMVKDIRSGKTPYERNSILLDRLQLRGGNTYRKFRHVLSLTGHRFLADHLYSEESDSTVLRPEDFFARFPGVFNQVSDDTKKRVLHYLETKIKERSLICDWIKTGPDRLDGLEARKESFYAEKQLCNRLEDKAKKLIHLEDDNAYLRNKISKQQSDINLLHRDIDEMKRSFKEELAKQSRFNAANNSSIIQLRDQFDTFHERVKVMNVYIRHFLHPEEDVSELEDDRDNIKISLLERNVKRLAQVARTNMETTTTSINEKEIVMDILKTSANHINESLPEIVHQHVKREEKAKQALAKEFDGILDMLRGNKFTAKMTAKPKVDMKLLKSQAAMIREEVEHIKKKLEWKDSQITELIEESMARDKAVVGHREAAYDPGQFSLPSVTEKYAPTSSPDSLKEMEKVYNQIDRYIAGTPMQKRRKPKRRGSLAEVNLEPDSPDDDDAKLGRDRGTTVSISLFDTPRAPPLDSVPRLPTYETSTSNDYVGIREATSSLLDDDITKLQARAARRFSRPEYIPSFRQGGRRPSLSDLITIYEKSQEPGTGVSVAE